MQVNLQPISVMRAASIKEIFESIYEITLKGMKNMTTIMT